MNKTIYLIALLTIAFAFGSCSRDEKSLFDRTSSERVQDVQDQLSANLIGASNGWEMLYFPTENAAGYAFLCKFKNDGSVTIAAKNPVSTKSAYKEETSLWTTYANQGAVLSFNSYNTLFHAFADPGSDGVGYGGDYEFMIIRENAKQILLKGKKHGAYVVMNALENGISWTDYFAQIDTFNDYVFTGNDGVDMTLNYDGGSQRTVYEGGTFSYTKNKTDYVYGFVITPSGLHFYNGIPTKDSVTLAYNFVISDDKSALVCTDEGMNASFVANYTPQKYFDTKLTSKYRWVFRPEYSSASVQSQYKALCDSAALNGAEITRVAYARFKGMTGSSNVIYISYLVNGKLQEALLNASIAASASSVSISYKSVDPSATSLLARISADQDAAIAMITDLFCGSFTPSSYTGSALNMMQMDLTSGDKKINVIADKTTY